MSREPEITIVGMGYVGLTLAATLADLGFTVFGYEREPAVVQRLNEGLSHIFEPGVDDILQSTIGRNLIVEQQLPQTISGAVILCVSTPVGADQIPDLSNLQAATTAVAEAATEGTLVIVRSTVPVGTCRDLVLPILESQKKGLHLASCPERTIQGRAIAELRNLPQVVGGVDEVSASLAIKLWEQVTGQVVTVESLETAELVKLVNNCHTDLIYSFGNEVAMMAQQYRLDPMEVIRAANVNYPRPDLARPGFVAGPCLTKDPYLLIDSMEKTGYIPHLVKHARLINESLSNDVAQHFMDCLKRATGELTGAKVLVCGLAYKGWPITDDVRGTPAIPIIEALLDCSIDVSIHDFMVAPEKMSSYGAKLVDDLRNGFHAADGVLFVNEHPEYRGLDIAQLAGEMQSPGVIYDCWRMFDHKVVESVPGISYGSIGFG